MSLCVMVSDVIGKKRFTQTSMAWVEELHS